MNDKTTVEDIKKDSPPVLTVEEAQILYQVTEEVLIKGHQNRNLFSIAVNKLVSIIQHAGKDTKR